jgi:hypothetical protein
MILYFHQLLLIAFWKATNLFQVLGINYDDDLMFDVIGLLTN